MIEAIPQMRQEWFTCFLDYAICDSCVHRASRVCIWRMKNVRWDDGGEGAAYLALFLIFFAIVYGIAFFAI